MPGVISLASLLIKETKQQIYARGIAVAQGLGLVTTSWIAGDPTRSLYWFLAETLSILEPNVAGFISSGFLDYATGVWLTVLADQLYQVERVEATYASCSVTLTNTGGGLYVLAAGDLTVKSAATGLTYRNTTGGTLGPVGTVNASLVLSVVADDAGTASSANIGAIDTLVTALLGVTCTNTTAAVGLDEEADQPLRDRCRAKLGQLSPDGPRSAYDFVVRDADLGSDARITRSRTLADDPTGNVTVYIAGASGALDSTAVTLATAAIVRWAAPLCITPTVVNANNVTIAVTYQIWIYASVGQDAGSIASKIQADLATMFAARPLGGDVIPPATTGKIYNSLIESTIKASFPAQTFRVLVTAPGSDTTMSPGDVAILGTVTGTVNLIADP